MLLIFLHVQDGSVILAGVIQV